MKTWGFIGKISLSLSACLALLALAACHPDEEEARRRPHVVEGEEAEVSLKWTMPAMEERQFQLCAPLSDERARRVEDLWIGIYNANTGECTTNVLLDLSSTDSEHSAQKLPTLKTKSGESYVVAVANVKKNFGFSARQAGSGQADTVPLVKLLQTANNWTDYKAVTAVLPKVDEVHPIGRTLVMAGSYYGSNDVNSEPSAWSDAAGNPAKVTLNPGGNTLNGYIHLRRLFAYNRFTVKPGDSVKMELLTWQVVNLPVMAYLQERLTENAADVSEYFADATGATEAYKGNYASSAASHIFEAGDKAGEYVFDFYQFENRHTGLPKNGEVGAATYNDRDREWKDASGGNTRVYKSLCANDATPVPGPAGKGVNTNNFATYVVINAEVSYYAASSDLNAPAIAHPDRPGTLPAGAVLRTGRAFYVVHLGYCEGGTDADKARDFNVRRNHWYDYTVTVKGLSNVALEARNKIEENQPGAEGNVYDSRYVVELDAHNAVFNIKLTNWQRTSLQWIIEAPYGNNPSQELSWKDYETGGETPALRENEFYNWIRFKPAPDSLLLAIYKEPGDQDKDLWTLEDLRDVAGHPGIDDQGQKEESPKVDDGSTARWYTVFVSEYVYEDDPTNEATGRWKMYANQPDRKAYLNTQEEVSADGHSRYMQPQYTIVQKSIQTYYNLQAGDLTTALGAERVNENYGMNLRWSSAADAKKPADGWNSNYGWMNTVAYAEGRPWYGTGGIFADAEQVGDRFYLHSASVPAITRQYENQPAKTYPIYAMNTISGFTATEDDPTSNSEFYEVMAACMNRNRDENGDNVVDKGEIKWYLASTDEYLRIVLGRESLKAPLMPFGVKIADKPGEGHASRHHYATSDKQMIWSEEGVSSSDLPGVYSWPWQVRCIRAMGIDFSNTNSSVQSAYWVDKTNRIVHFDYYDEASLRPYQATRLPVHSVGDLINRAGRQLEYAREDAKSIDMTNKDGLSIGSNPRQGSAHNGSSVLYGYTPEYDNPADVLMYYAGSSRYRDGLMDSWIYYDYFNQAGQAEIIKFWAASAEANQLCGKYMQPGDAAPGTWRVPNQVELTVMLRLGIMDVKDGYWLSCTREYYSNDANPPSRFVSVRRKGGNMVTLGGGAPFRVRCVRDVD